MRLKGWNPCKNQWRMWDNRCRRANTNVRPYTHFKLGKLWLKRVAAPMISSFLSNLQKRFFAQ